LNSKRSWDWLWLAALCAAIVALDWRLLAGGVPRNEDNLLAFLPAYAVGDQDWPPAWNPHILGGAPWAANPQYSRWYPPRWLFQLADVRRAYGPFLFLHFVIAAAAMFAGLRAFGCGAGGAGAGALAFAGGAYIQGHLSNPGLLISSVWLPLVAMMARRAIARPGLLWPAALALALAVVVFAGSPHTMLYAALLVGLMALWEIAIGGLGDEAPWRRRTTRTAGHLALAAALALGLSAAQLAPTAEFARLSFRHTLPVADLARDPLAWDWLDNLFTGTPLPSEYLDKATYFGLSMLSFLLLAIVAPLHRRRAWFFAMLAVVGAWMALGMQAGAFQAFARVPVLRSMSGPSRALVLFAFATAALVGFGVDAFLKRENVGRKISLWIVVIACAGLAAWLLASVGGRLSGRDVASAALRAATPLDPALFLALNAAFFIALGLLVFVGGLWRRLRRPWFGLAIAAVLLVDLLHFSWRLPLGIVPGETVWEGKEAGLLESIRAGYQPAPLQPFRVVGYEPTRLHAGDVNSAVLRAFLMPNLAALEGLRDVQGFDPLILGDYARLVTATAGRAPTDDPVRMLNIARPDPTLFRLLNVLYVIGDARERLMARPMAAQTVFVIPLDAPTTIAGVSLVSLLDGAENVPQGAPVAAIIARGEGTSATAALQAGVHTADFRAINRDFPGRHEPADRNMVWEIQTPARPAPVANYYGQVRFARPVRARAIEIRRLVREATLWVGTVGVLLPESPAWEKIHEEGRVRVYRNREALGGAWIVRRYRRAVDPADALAMLAGGGVDLAREAVVPVEMNPPEGDARAGGPPDRVEFVRYDPDEIEVRVETAGPGLLVFAEVFYPGWRGELDGRPAEIWRVNYLLRGVALPAAGEHRVTLRFAPNSLFHGKIVSLLSALAIAAIVVASRNSRPHAPREAPHAEREVYYKG